jgi:hypothetical protein
MSSIAINQWGATLEQQQSAGRLLSTLHEDSEARGGFTLVVEDKVIAADVAFDTFWAATWMEDGSDVCMQLYPPKGHARFDEFHWFLEMADKAFERVFQGVCGVEAQFYESRMSHRVRLVHDPKRRGMDLLQVRVTRLYKVPRYETLVRDIYQLLEKCAAEHIQPE